MPKAYWPGELAAVPITHELAKIRNADRWEAIDLVRVGLVYHKPLVMGLSDLGPEEAACGVEADFVFLRKAWVIEHTELRPCTRCWRGE